MSDANIRALRLLAEDSERLTARYRDLVDAIEKEQRPDLDPWLGLSAIKDYCGRGRAAVVAATKDGRLSIAPRAKPTDPILARRSDVDRWLSSGPSVPPPVKAAPADDDAAAQAQLEAFRRGAA
jgi:hypothetical protein